MRKGDTLRCRCGCGLRPQPRLMQVVNRIALQLESDGEAPILITSGARCRAHNRRVGGSPTSRHMDGLAVDVSCTCMGELRAIWRAVDGLPVHQFIVYPKRRIVHVGLWLDPAQMARGSCWIEPD